MANNNPVLMLLFITLMFYHDTERSSDAKMAYAADPEGRKMNSIFWFISGGGCNCK
jgi:hypothetical protein